MSATVLPRPMSYSTSANASNVQVSAQDGNPAIEVFRRVL